MSEDSVYMLPILRNMLKLAKQPTAWPIFINTPFTLEKKLHSSAGGYRAPTGPLDRTCQLRHSNPMFLLTVAVLLIKYI